MELRLSGQKHGPALRACSCSGQNWRVPCRATLLRGYVARYTNRRFVSCSAGDEVKRRFSLALAGITAPAWANSGATGGYRAGGHQPEKVAPLTKSLLCWLFRYERGRTQQVVVSTRAAIGRQRISLSTLLYIWAGTIPRLQRDVNWAGQSHRNSVLRKQIRLQSESIPADICLGVCIAGVNTLIGIGIGLIILM